MTSIHFLLVSTLLSDTDREPAPHTHTHVSLRAKVQALPKTQPDYDGKGLTCLLLSVPRALPTRISPAAPTTHLG